MHDEVKSIRIHASVHPLNYLRSVRPSTPPCIHSFVLAQRLMDPLNAHFFGRFVVLLNRLWFKVLPENDEPGNCFTTIQARLIHVYHVINEIQSYCKCYHSRSVRNMITPSIIHIIRGHSRLQDILSIYTCQYNWRESVIWCSLFKEWTTIDLHHVVYIGTRKKNTELQHYSFRCLAKNSPRWLSRVPEPNGTYWTITWLLFVFYNQ